MLKLGRDTSSRGSVSQRTYYGNEDNLLRSCASRIDGGATRSQTRASTKTDQGTTRVTMTLNNAPNKKSLSVRTTYSEP